MGILKPNRETLWHEPRKLWMKIVQVWNGTKHVCSNAIPDSSWSISAFDWEQSSNLVSAECIQIQLLHTFINDVFESWVYLCIEFECEQWDYLL